MPLLSTIWSHYHWRHEEHSQYLGLWQSNYFAVLTLLLRHTCNAKAIANNPQYCVPCCCWTDSLCSSKTGAQGAGWYIFVEESTFVFMNSPTLQNKVVFLTTEWQRERLLPSSSYNHNTLTTLRTSVKGVITNTLQSCCKELSSKQVNRSQLSVWLLSVCCGCEINWALASGVALCN